MGIRFKCHHCFHSMHLKTFQAGKRGVCPACRGRFRIPKESQEYSSEINSSSSSDADYLALLEPNLLKRRSTGPQKEANLEDEKAFTYLSPESLDDTFSSNLRKEKSSKNRNRSGERQGDLSNKDDRSISTKSSRSSASSKNKSGRPGQNGSESNVSQSKKEGDRAYFVSPPSGGQYGPANQLTIDAWIEQRRVTADTLVWYEGLDGWRPATDVFPYAFLDVAGDDLSTNIAIRKSRFDGLLPETPEPTNSSRERQATIGELPVGLSQDYSERETPVQKRSTQNLAKQNRPIPGANVSRFSEESNATILSSELKQKSAATIRFYWIAAIVMSLFVILLFFGLVYLVTR